MINLTNLVFTIESLFFLNLVIIIIALINQVIVEIALLIFKITLINLDYATATVTFINLFALRISQIDLVNIILYHINNPSNRHYD